MNSYNLCGILLFIFKFILFEYILLYFTSFFKFAFRLFHKYIYSGIVLIISNYLPVFYFFTLLIFVYTQMSFLDYSLFSKFHWFCVFYLWFYFIFTIVMLLSIIFMDFKTPNHFKLYVVFSYFYIVFYD